MTASGDQPAGNHPGQGDVAGLSALYAALERTATRHGLDALGVAVADPDLGRQLFAVGAAKGDALAALAADPSRPWSALPDPEAPPAEIDVLRTLASTALRLSRADPAADPASALEVVVRGLPGAQIVARQGSVVEVTAAPGTRDALTARLARTDLPGAGAVIVHESAARAEGATAPANRRAVLLSVQSLPEGGELEVHLRAGDRRTVGRGPLMRAGLAAAAATLEALAALATDAAEDQPRWRVGWVRTIDTTPGRAFLVAVAIGRDEGSTLYGLAEGASPIEAAARATLHACNRIAARDSHGLG